MIKEKKSVSVIIPNFNRATLMRAIGSCLQQTIGLDALEVLVIDDCSTDESRNFANRLGGAFVESVKVFANERNRGPGYCRNKGIDCAEGNYLFFLDSDDFLVPNAIEKMYRCAEETGSEIVIAKKARMDGRIHASGSTRETRMKADIYDSDAFFTIGPASKLFKSNFVQTNNIRFNETRRWGEDQPFVIDSYFSASQISILADQIYTYIDGDHLSLTKQDNRHGDKLETALQVLDIIARKSKKDSSAFRAAIFSNSVLPAIVELVSKRCLSSGDISALKFLFATYFEPSVSEKLTQKEAELARQFLSSVLVSSEKRRRVLG